MARCRNLMLAASVAVASAAVGCGPSETPVADAGPLALLDEPPNGQEALLEGTLVVTDRCTFIEPSGGDRILISWSAEVTRWTGEAIEYGTNDGKVELRSGDSIAIGGGGSSTSEGGEDFEAYVASRDWVAPPDTSCASDARWFAGELVDQ